MFFSKDNPYSQSNQPSTFRRRKSNFPKPTAQTKDPFDMDNMKKLLQNISNDMVDLKRTNTETQENNIGLERPPFIRPYQPPPPNPKETSTFDNIYSILRP